MSFSEDQVEELKANVEGKTPLRRILRHKYNAKSTIYNDRRYQSKREASYAKALDLKVRAGIVIFYLEQVPFRLPGKIRYLCDFEVFYSDGHIEFVDVKGFKTQVYAMKKKQTEEIYPIKIIEV